MPWVCGNAPLCKVLLTGGGVRGEATCIWMQWARRRARGLKSLVAQPARRATPWWDPTRTAECRAWDDKASGSGQRCASHNTLQRGGQGLQRRAGGGGGALPPRERIEYFGDLAETEEAKLPSKAKGPMQRAKGWEPMVEVAASAGAGAQRKKNTPRVSRLWFADLRSTT